MFTENDFKKTIREIPDYPKKGILFYDITTLLKDGKAYNELITAICDSLRGLDIDYLEPKMIKAYGIFDSYSAEDVKRAIDKAEVKPEAVFITSPTYEGKCSERNISITQHLWEI